MSLSEIESLILQASAKDLGSQGLFDGDGIEFTRPYIGALFNKFSLFHGSAPIASSDVLMESLLGKWHIAMLLEGQEIPV
jgi:hypothetical protein